MCQWYTYIRRVKSPQNVCRGFFEGYYQAQAGTRPQNQAQGRQARDRRAETALPGCLHVLESSVCVKSGEAACTLTSTERSHSKGANPVTPRALVASPKSMKGLVHIDALQHMTWSHIHYQTGKVA